jgi:acyl transferase domain-containing protein
MKLVLMLQRGVLPPAIAPGTVLNPLVPWASLSVEVPDQARPWPSRYPHRIAGISAFGLSGTNAHAILAGYVAPPRAATAPACTELLVLSAKDPVALRQLAELVVDQLPAVERAGELADFCHTLRAGRVGYDCRVAVLGSDAGELVAELRQWLDGQNPTAKRLVGRPVLALGEDAAQVSAVQAELSLAFPRLAGLDLLGMVRQLGISATLSSPAAPAGLRLADNHWPLFDADPAAAPRLLLAAVAALFRGGYPLRLEALAAPDVRMVAGTPTYPFQRERFWIDEVDLDNGPAVSPVIAPATEAEFEQELATLEELLPVQTFLLEELAVVLRAQHGIDPELSFLEVGGDSFTAMLLAKSFAQYYGIEIPVEEFAIDVPLADLSRHLQNYLSSVGTLMPELAGQQA